MKLRKMFLAAALAAVPGGWWHRRISLAGQSTRCQVEDK